MEIEREVNIMYKCQKSENLYHEIFLPAPVSMKKVQKEQLRLIQEENVKTLFIVVKRDGSGIAIHYTCFSPSFVKTYLSKTP